MSRPSQVNDVCKMFIFSSLHRRSAAGPQRSRSTLGEITRFKFLFQLPCHLGAENKMEEMDYGKARMCLAWIKRVWSFVSLKTFHYQSGPGKTSSSTKHDDISSYFLPSSFKTVRKFLQLKNNSNSEIMQLKTYISLLLKF